MPSIVSVHTPNLIKEIRETAKSPIDVKTAIMMFRPNFADFVEKAGTAAGKVYFGIDKYTKKCVEYSQATSSAVATSKVVDTGAGDLCADN